ncbi:MAG: marine proteobacterial sortase target protein [Thermoanaerobaculia bacterium]
MRSNVFRAVGMFLFVLMAGLGACGAHAAPARQGLIIDGVPAPVLGSQLDVRVTGIIARSRMTQIFTNPAKAWVEGIYVFPLPEGAAVDALRMKIGDRTVEGTIQARREARETYEAAKQAGARATLIEQQDPGVFTASVANIGPGETVEVAIEMQQVVRYEGGRFILRFPMVVAPPAEAARKRWRTVPPVLPRGSAPIHPFAFHADLQPGFPLASIESPTHPIVIEKGKKLDYAIDLKDGTAFAQGDIALEWRPAVGREPRAVYYSETLGSETYALLMVMPPDAPTAAAARLPRETTFIIDVSGSMNGVAIDQAKRALLAGLGKLQSSDRFNVIRFSNEAVAAFPESVPASPDALRQARGFVELLAAAGGTTMLPALEIAFRKPAPAGFVPQVIFATDGELEDQSKVSRFIADHAGERRLFPIAIGSNPNLPFLRKAADLGRGVFTQIQGTDEIAKRMETLFARLEYPMLQELDVQWSDAAAESWPARVPDLYLGEPLVVAARLPNGPGAVKASGRRGGEVWEDSFPVASEVKGGGIDKLWARRKIDSLLDSLAEGADPGEVRRVVTELGLRHRLVTSYTSLVAADTEVSAPANAQPVTRVLPVNAPAPQRMAEMIIVTQESPLLDERRLSTGCTVSQTELEKIPTMPDGGPWAMPQVEAGALCAAIRSGGWKAISLDRALAAAPSLGKEMKEAETAGLLRGFLALALRGWSCSEPSADVVRDAAEYLETFGPPSPG